LERPKGAFWYYQNERSAALFKEAAAKEEKLTRHEVSKMCNNEWRYLEEAQRIKYKQLAAMDLKRYDEERGRVYKQAGLSVPAPYQRQADRKKEEKKRLFGDMMEADKSDEAAAPTGPRRILKAKRLAGVSAPTQAKPVTRNPKDAVIDMAMDEDDEGSAKKQRNAKTSDAGAKKGKKPKIEERDKLSRILAESMKQKPVAKEGKKSNLKKQLHKKMKKGQR